MDYWKLTAGVFLLAAIIVITAGCTGTPEEMYPYSYDRPSVTSGVSAAPSASSELCGVWTGGKPKDCSGFEYEKVITAFYGDGTGLVYFSNDNRHRGPYYFTWRDENTGTGYYGITYSKESVMELGTPEETYFSFIDGELKDKDGYVYTRTSGYGIPQGDRVSETVYYDADHPEAGYCEYSWHFGADGSVEVSAMQNGNEVYVLSGKAVEIAGGKYRVSFTDGTVKKIYFAENMIIDESRGFYLPESEKGDSITGVWKQKSESFYDPVLHVYVSFKEIFKPDGTGIELVYYHDILQEIVALTWKRTDDGRYLIEYVKSDGTYTASVSGDLMSYAEGGTVFKRLSPEEIIDPVCGVWYLDNSRTGQYGDGESYTSIVFADGIGGTVHYSDGKASGIYLFRLNMTAEDVYEVGYLDSRSPRELTMDENKMYLSDSVIYHR